MAYQYNCSSVAALWPAASPARPACLRAENMAPLANRSELRQVDVLPRVHIHSFHDTVAV
jgi:hypothetical protein